MKKLTTNTTPATPALLRALTNMGHHALLRGVAPEGTLGLPVFEAIGQGVLWAAHQLQHAPEELGDEAPVGTVGEPLWDIIPTAAEHVLEAATDTPDLEWWWELANEEPLEEPLEEYYYTPAEGALVVAFRLMTTPEELEAGDPVPPVQRFRDALGAVAAPAPEDKPQPQPEGVTRVEALEAFGRIVLEGREDTLTPHEALLGRAIIEDAIRIHEESGDVWSDPEDFLWEASRAWVKREATERLRELWELPEKELWGLPERSHHLRRLLVSFQEEANGSLEEAIRLLREYIG